MICVHAVTPNPRFSVVGDESRQRVYNLQRNEMQLQVVIDDGSKGVIWFTTFRGK